MRFGIQLGDILSGEWTSAQVQEHLRQRAELAASCNFDGLFAAQHYLTGPSASMVQPLVLLAYAAGLAPHMYLGTSVFLLPLHHPIEVAEQIASLDVLCGGKLLFGIGLGYREQEFTAFGVDKASRRQRAREAMELIRRLWVEDNVTFSGRFFQVRDATIRPKPIQQPGPPVLVGADTLATVSRVPELGDHWIASRRHSITFLRQALPAYQDALARRDKPFKGVPMFRDLCVAEKAAEAEERIRKAYEATYQLYHRWGQPGEPYDLPFHELKRERLLVGSPDQVRDQVLAYHSEFGTDFMWFFVHWPGMDPAWTLETVRLFGEEVIPQLRKALPPSGIPWT